MSIRRIRSKHDEIFAGDLIIPNSVIKVSRGYVNAYGINQLVVKDVPWPKIKGARDWDRRRFSESQISGLEERKMQAQQNSLESMQRALRAQRKSNMLRLLMHISATLGPILAFGTILLHSFRSRCVEGTSAISSSASTSAGASELDWALFGNGIEIFSTGACIANLLTGGLSTLDLLLLGLSQKHRKMHEVSMKWSSLAMLVEEALPLSTHSDPDHAYSTIDRTFRVFVDDLLKSNIRFKRKGEGHTTDDSESESACLLCPGGRSDNDDSRDLKFIDV